MSSSTKAPGLRSASTGAAAAVAATAAASSSSSTSSVEKIAPPSITASEQALAACSGSVITSVLMTPFDVVKVRQQAWAHNSHNSSFAVVGRVVRAEGVSSLWSGLTPTLLMSVPSTLNTIATEAMLGVTQRATLDDHDASSPTKTVAKKQPAKARPLPSLVVLILAFTTVVVLLVKLLAGEQLDE